MRWIVAVVLIAGCLPGVRLIAPGASAADLHPVVLCSDESWPPGDLPDLLEPPLLEMPFPARQRAASAFESHDEPVVRPCRSPLARAPPLVLLT